MCTQTQIVQVIMYKKVEGKTFYQASVLFCLQGFFYIFPVNNALDISEKG